jgi:hypothetical protein
MDAELEAGEAAPQGTFGTFTGRGARKRPGRRPAETPDAALGAEALVTTIRGKFPFISGAFNAVDVEGGRIELEWLGRVQFAKRDLQVVHCLETGRRPYNGAFVTDLMICGGTDALGICTWGRRRWNIESDFNVEKHGGFGLEHTFCTSDRQAANMQHASADAARPPALAGGLPRRPAPPLRRMPEAGAEKARSTDTKGLAYARAAVDRTPVPVAFLHGVGSARNAGSSPGQPYDQGVEGGRRLPPHTLEPAIRPKTGGS